MARLFTLLLCLSVPGALSQCNVQRAQPIFKRSAYEFAVELTARLAQDKENHFVASTLSPWSLLGTISLGAAGDTLSELKKVLRLHGQPCFNDRYFELIRSVTSEATNVTLRRSSTIFVDENLRVTDVFRQRVTDAGVSAIEFLPFDNPESIAATINDYVSRATQDTIFDIVSPNDLNGVYIAMIDAVYFKGMWQTPFPYENTEIQPFYNDIGDQVGEVNSMFVTGTFNCSTFKMIDARVLELPFGEDGRYAMLVFLPRGNTTLSAVISSLMEVSLTTIYAIFNQDDMQYISVQLPKFKITSDLDNLKELLSDMGLKKIFDSQQAQFPYISDYGLYVSNFVQKANVEVTEEGAVASAASGGFFASRSSPEIFRVNKPFFYMIVDTQNQLPIFTGAYSKPSVF